MKAQSIKINRGLLVLACLILLLICSFLIIPWAYIDEMTSSKVYIGYSFLWDEPKLKEDAEMKKVFGISDGSRVHIFEVVTFTLLTNLERMALLAFLLSCLIGTYAKIKFHKIVAGAIALVGFFLAYLWIYTLIQVR